MSTPVQVDVVVPDHGGTVEIVTASTSATIDIATLGPTGQTGPQGPQGGTGGTGPQGPQGVTGPAVDTAALYASMGYLAVGQETVPRWAATNSSAVNYVNAGSRIRFGYLTARKSETVRYLRVVCGTAAAATPTTVKFGLYSVAANGDLTLIGATANDTTMLAGANVQYQKALLAQVPATAGAFYAIGVLVVTPVGAPTIYGGNATGAAAESNTAPKLSGYIDGQSDLGSGYTAAQVLASPAMPYAVLVP